METRLSEEKKQFIIDNINDKFTKLCIPAKVHRLEYDTITKEYYLKSDEFNTVPSLFRKVFVWGRISPTETDIKDVHCIDYLIRLEYHFEYYGGGENGANIMYTKFRSFSTDNFESIREFSR